MEGKKLSPQPPMTMMVLFLCIIFQNYFSKALASSTVVLTLNKNGYTGWAYFTNMNIGIPHKSFELHVDTGSDLTWVQCDGPCKDEDCTVPREALYKPPENSIVECQDRLCKALHGDDHHCPNPTGPCEYALDLMDQKSTAGYLVKDIFPLRLTNGTVIHPHVVFGCGNEQTGDLKGHGVLGLGRGELSVLSQLVRHGAIQKVVGHCFSSGQGGGSLYLGDHAIYSTVSWVKLHGDHKESNYWSEAADLLFDGQETKLKELVFDFDSGVGLTYLQKAAYKHTLDLIDRHLVGTHLMSVYPAGHLPKCWRNNEQPIRSLDDATHFFKNLTLKFPESPNSMLELSPRNYLIHVGENVVCFRISDGDEAGLQNPYVIGVNLMLDKLVIYDTIHSVIGWAPRRSCDMA